MAKIKKGKKAVNMSNSKYSYVKIPAAKAIAILRNGNAAQFI